MHKKEKNEDKPCFEELNQWIFSTEGKWLAWKSFMEISEENIAKLDKNLHFIQLYISSIFLVT
jgi:hypothetical protein